MLNSLRIEYKNTKTHKTQKQKIDKKQFIQHIK